MDNEFRLSFTAEEIDEKLRKVDSMGTSVQSDWNQTDSSAADFIKNKPFGDMPTGGDTIEWDGNTEGLVSTADMFYKVSDAVPTMDDLANGAVLGISDSEIFEIPADAIMDGTVDGYPCIMIGEVYVALEDEANLDGLYFPQKGVYFIGADDAYISSLTIPNYTGFPVTKKMEEKYLPGAVILYADDKAYLCSDSGVSERITKTQLVNSFENGRVLVDLSAAGMPCKSTITGVIEEENYAMGLCVLPDIGAMGLYTAEYTAS